MTSAVSTRGSRQGDWIFPCKAFAWRSFRVEKGWNDACTSGDGRKGPIVSVPNAFACWTMQCSRVNKAWSVCEFPHCACAFEVTCVGVCIASRFALLDLEHMMDGSGRNGCNTCIKKSNRYGYLTTE